MIQFEACNDCDGSCIGSQSCAQSDVLGTLGSEFYYVCRSCKKNGCIMTKDEFEKLPEECIERISEAERRIIEFENEVFKPMSRSLLDSSTVETRN